MRESEDSVSAPHRFSGPAGDLADLMAQVARLLSRPTSHSGASRAEIALWHKRLRVAINLARHDEEAARSALERLLQDRREAGAQR